MTRSQKKKFYVAFVIVIALIFTAGVLLSSKVGGQHCPDKKAPVAENVDATLGQTMYLCHDGAIVTVSP